MNDFRLRVPPEEPHGCAETVGTECHGCLELSCIREEWRRHREWRFYCEAKGRSVDPMAVEGCARRR